MLSHSPDLTCLSIWLGAQRDLHSRGTQSYPRSQICWQRPRDKAHARAPGARESDEACTGGGDTRRGHMVVQTAQGATSTSIPSPWLHRSHNKQRDAICQPGAGQPGWAGAARARGTTASIRHIYPSLKEFVADIHVSLSGLPPLYLWI